MYDAQHRFFVVSSNPSVDDRLLQKGLRERMLCEDCDNVLLSDNERYASRVIYGGELIQTVVSDNDLRLRGFDYQRLRLFYLSLLWRMGVSTLPYFQEVSLGPHEDMIRLMILEKRPGEPDQYGMLCVAPVFQGKDLGHMMMPPERVRVHGRSVYRCVIGRLLYCFFVGKSWLPSDLVDRFILKDRSWVIRREKIERIPYLADLAVRIGAAMEERRREGRGRV